MRLRAVLPDLHHSPHTTSMARSTPPFPTSLLGCTASWACGILVAGVLLTAAACEQETLPSGPTEADRARCAHVEDPFLNMVCLDNPWPTELPPATQEGLSTFGCWINDTLAFVASDPREPARKEAYGIMYADVQEFQISANWNTYNSIDDRSIYLSVYLKNKGDHWSLLNRSDLRISRIYPFSGFWELDTLKSNLSLSNLSALAASGTFSLVFYLPNTTDTLRLTDGRFDVKVTTF